MKKQVKLYNVIFPIWVLMFWPNPPVILITLFGNLAVDALVLYLALRALKVPERGGVMKTAWWRVWRNGFLADVIGAAWLALGLFGTAWLDVALDAQGAGWFNDFASAMTLNPFRHPLALEWTAIGVVIAGVCIYFFDKRALKKCEGLDDHQRHTAALAMAIVTAPWLFFIPMYI